MATIKLTSLNKQQISNKYLHRDIALDIRNNNILPERGLYRESTTNDVQASNDEAAIKNSLSNLFNTMPGQKLLNPEYGLNLAQFLFAPVSEPVARSIGEKILDGLRQFEPRVSIININVDPQDNQNQYSIDLALKIPSLSNTSFSISGILKQPGFTFL